MSWTQPPAQGNPQQAAQADHDMKISLWPRKFKSGPQAGRDYLGGEVRINGVKYWVDIFPNDYFKGGTDPTFKGRLKLADGSPQQPPQPAPQHPSGPPITQQPGTAPEHYDQHGRLLNEPFLNDNFTRSPPQPSGPMMACPNCKGTGYDQTGRCTRCHGRALIPEDVPQ